MTVSHNTTQVDPFQDTMQVCTLFLESLDCPRALSVNLLAKSYLPHDPMSFANELANLKVNYEEYQDSATFAADYQATVLFSKLPSPIESPALRAAAIEGFKDGEKQCQLTNERWSNESKVESDLFKLGLTYQELKDTIRQILGRAPSLRTLAKKGKWTNGASLLFRKDRAHEAMKCEFGISCTFPLAKAINSTCCETDTVLINWSSPLVLTPGNLVDTVPKNIVTDRTIAKEPEINMFFQNAIGSIIRTRLQDVGIDLTDQSNNQWCAMNAERLKLATIDLKNASNTISRMLVFQLLPPDWRELIFLTRSSYGSFDNRTAFKKRQAEWFEYEMISSMGNGFTFELESLLFFAIAISAGSPDWSTYVYGDDIIVPQRCVPKLVPILEYCGFEINTAKSFVSGTFFESCGVYSFNGYDVTPIKIKALLHGPKDCIILANKIRWFSHLRTGFTHCDRRQLPAWQACIHRLPADIRSVTHGPVGGGLYVWKNRNEVPRRKLKHNRNKANYQQEILYELRANTRAEALSCYHYGVFIAALNRVKSIDYYADPYWESASISFGNKVVPHYETYSVGKIIHDGSTWYDLGIWQ